MTAFNEKQWLCYYSSQHLCSFPMLWFHKASRLWKLVEVTLDCCSCSCEISQFHDQHARVSEWLDEQFSVPRKKFPWISKKLLSPIDVTKGLVGGVVPHSKSNLEYTIGYHHHSKDAMLAQRAHEPWFIHLILFWHFKHWKFQFSWNWKNFV